MSDMRVVRVALGDHFGPAVRQRLILGGFIASAWLLSCAFPQDATAQTLPADLKGALSQCQAIFASCGAEADALRDEAMVFHGMWAELLFQPKDGKSNLLDQFYQLSRQSSEQRERCRSTNSSCMSQVREIERVDRESRRREAELQDSQRPEPETLLDHLRAAGSVGEAVNQIVQHQIDPRGDGLDLLDGNSLLSKGLNLLNPSPLSKMSTNISLTGTRMLIGDALDKLDTALELVDDIQLSPVPASDIISLILGKPDPALSGSSRAAGDFQDRTDIEDLGRGPDNGLGPDAPLRRLIPEPSRTGEGQAYSEAVQEAREGAELRNQERLAQNRMIMREAAETRALAAREEASRMQAMTPAVEEPSAQTQGTAAVGIPDLTCSDLSERSWAVWPYATGEDKSCEGPEADEVEMLCRQYSRMGCGIESGSCRSGWLSCSRFRGL